MPGAGCSGTHPDGSQDLKAGVQITVSDCETRGSIGARSAVSDDSIKTFPRPAAGLLTANALCAKLL
jgi:hypothetical protein